jgi:hypothetical protein
VNLAPRSRAATLMINGKDDFINRTRPYKDRSSTSWAYRKTRNGTHAWTAGTCHSTGTIQFEVSQIFLIVNYDVH